MKKVLLALVAFATLSTSAFADDIIKNGSFESWTNGVADSWKSTTSASNATVRDTTEARTGSKGVVVEGSTSGNKRLGSCEYTLKAGTYKISAYAKGTALANVGYVPSTDGSVGTYVYSKANTQLSETEWTELTLEFTLEEQTTVNFVLFNKKDKDGAKYIVADDYSVTTTDGGIVESETGGETGGDSGEVTTPEATGDGSFENPFNPIAASNTASALASGAQSDGWYYIKGIISKIANNGEFGANFGNATFYISEDGQTDNSFYVYRALYLENQKWVEGQTNIKVGDEVVVYAKVMNYKGNTPETVQGSGYIYSLNGVVTGVTSATVAPAAKATIYGLDGRKVSKAGKGVYIINGKKVIK